MPDKIIYKKPKLEVQRYRNVIYDNPDTTQQNFTLHTTTQKSTIMGFKVKVTVQGNASAGNALTRWIMYTTTEDGTRTLSMAASDNDNAMDKEELEYLSELTGPYSSYTYFIKSKAKRKLNSGDKVKLSYDSSTVDANTLISWDIILNMGT